MQHGCLYSLRNRLQHAITRSMTKREALLFFGSNAALAKAAGVNRITAWRWKKEIPLKYRPNLYHAAALRGLERGITDRDLKRVSRATKQAKR